jgi:hypothetical protein
LDCLPEDEKWQVPSGEEDGSPNDASGRRGLSAPPQLGQEGHTNAKSAEFAGATSCPSSREGTSGWDFCSEASETLSWVTDAESEATVASLIDLHGADAVDCCGDVATPCGRDEPSRKDRNESSTKGLPAEEAWQTVGKKKGKNSFSQVLREGPMGKAQDCAKATRPAESRMPPKSQKDAPLAVTKPFPGVAQQTTSAYDITSDDDCDYQDSQDSRIPGWNRGQKASHSVKYRTKVQYQTDKRNGQRCRGF